MDKIRNATGALNSSQRITLWDRMTDNFSNEVPLTPDNSEILALLQRNGALQSSYRILDIGCATGRYAFAFAQMCKEVVAVDISGKMLEKAREHQRKIGSTNTHFVQADWLELNLMDIGGAGSFDLVFANMSPGVYDPRGLAKMLQAGRNWFYFGGGASRKRLVTDTLYAHLGLDTQFPPNTATIPKVLDLLWQEGIRPQLCYASSVSNSDMSLDQAKAYYHSVLEARLQMEGITGQYESYFATADAFLESIAKDGAVHERIQGTTAVLLWNQKIDKGRS